MARLHIFPCDTHDYRFATVFSCTSDHRNIHVKCTFVRICCVSTKCCLRSHSHVLRQRVTPLSKWRNELGAELPYSRQKHRFSIGFRIATQDGGINVGVVAWGGGCLFRDLFSALSCFLLSFRFDSTICFLLLPSVSSCPVFFSRWGFWPLFRKTTTDMIMRSETKAPTSTKTCCQ